MNRILFILLSLSPFLSFSQGNCLDFDGVNDRFRIESEISGASDFTIEFWMYAHDNNAMNDLYVTWGGFGKRFEIRTDGSGRLAIYQNRWHNTDTYVSKNTWYHIAVTRTNNVCKLYLNGVLKLNFTPQFLLNTYINVFHWYSQNAYHVRGKLDEFRMWNSARTQNDINESMNCEMVGDEPNLVGYWNFNQEIPGGNNAGKTIAHDNSVNNNDGTLRNFSLNGSTSNWISSNADIPNSCSCISDDITPPTAICQDITVYLNANGQAVITPDMINNGSTDDCTDEGDLTLSLSQTSFDCDDLVAPGGWENVGNAGFSAGEVHHLSLVFNNNEPYVAYLDRGNDFKCTVMKYDGTNWVNVGNPGFSAGDAYFNSLAFYNDEPYVAYQDYGSDNKTTVMKYDGTNWVHVGSPGFSDGVAQYQSLAFYNGEPYVAFRNGGSGYKSTVMKFNGSNWVNVGDPGFSEGFIHFQSLAFHNGEPYVAYHDRGNSRKTTVMKYNGTNWVNVGNAGFSKGEANFQSLAFYNGEPYVAYLDCGNGSKATVMKYNGSNWVNVGNAGFTEGKAYSQDLVFYNGEPFVAFQDWANGYKTTVMKYDGSNWVIVGSAGFSAGHSNYQNLAFNDGEPYVAYSDRENGDKTTMMKFVDLPSPTTILTVTDEAGNSSTCTATVTVEDNLAPITADNPTDIILCGAQIVSWTAPSATDNCGTVTMSSSHEPGDYFAIGTTQVSYDFTDESGNTASCNFNVIIGEFPLIDINHSSLPDFCQGTSLLEAILHNGNDLATPFSYAWSDGLGSEVQATVLSNGSYTVTVTDDNGCNSYVSTLIDEVESDNFSSYVLLANLEIKTKRTTMTGGGIGVYGVNKKARILKSSLVNTFVKAPIIQVKSGSTVASTIVGDADVALPDFVFNTTNCSNNIVVQPGETVTLTDNTYGKITIKEDGVLIINSPDWYVNEIDMKQYSELKFDQPTNVIVKTRMRIGKNAIINIDGEAVTFYIEENFEVKEGTDFSGHVYAKQKIFAKKAKNSNQTYMKGTFVSEDVIQSDDFVNWDWAEFCNAESIIGDPLGCDDPMAFSAIINEYDQVNAGLLFIEEEKSLNLTILPNPSLGSFDINMTSYIGHHVEISIYNNLGIRVQHFVEKQLSNPSFNLDLSNHDGVTYHIKFIIDGKEKINKKLVVIRP